MTSEHTKAAKRGIKMNDKEIQRRFEEFCNSDDWTCPIEKKKKSIGVKNTPSQSVEIVDPEGSCKKDNTKPIYSNLDLGLIHNILLVLQPLGYKLETIINRGFYEVHVKWNEKSYTIEEVIDRYFNVYGFTKEEFYQKGWA